MLHGTAELRFVAIPGLLLVGVAVALAAALAVKAVPGSERRKMSVAPALAVPYALLLDFLAQRRAPGAGMDRPVGNLRRL